MSLFISFIFLHCLFILSSSAPIVPCYFIFGDSVSDNGNNNYLHLRCHNSCMFPSYMIFPLFMFLEKSWPYVLGSNRPRSSHCIAKLQVLDKIFASQMQKLLGNALQEKDLEPPPSVIEVRSMFARVL